MNLNSKKANNSSAHKNYMDGVSFELSPLLRLYSMACSSFFGEPQYYNQKDCAPLAKRIKASYKLNAEDAKHLKYVLKVMDPKFFEWRDLSTAEAMEKAIDEALDENPEWVLKFACYLRNVENIRTTPQVIIARAARHEMVRGTGLIMKYGPDVMKRIDETTVVLAYYIEKFGKPIPNSLKKLLKLTLENADEYKLSKYRLENHVVKLKDVVRLCHPKSMAIDSLMQDTLRVTDKTWEGIISSKGSTKDTWLEALNVMGHMALLRNLRNFEKVGIDYKDYTDKLQNGVKSGKQFPFRYYSAYMNVGGYKIKAALEKCIDISVDNLPQMKGRSLVLVDNSGSARGTTTSSMGKMRIATIGNLTGIFTCKASDEGILGVFGDALEMVPIAKNTPSLRMLEHIEKIGERIGHGTENGIWLAFDKVIKSNEWFDRIFIYSDQQAGHGGLYGFDGEKYPRFPNKGMYIDVPALIKEYRQRVNPNAHIYSVQTAGYADNVLPEYYDRTFILSGWSENIIKFAYAMENMNYKSVIELY